METALMIALIILGVLMIILIWGECVMYIDIDGHVTEIRFLPAACSCAGCCDSGPILELPRTRRRDSDDDSDIWFRRERETHILYH